MLTHTDYVLLASSNSIRSCIFLKFLFCPLHLFPLLSLSEPNCSLTRYPALQHVPYIHTIPLETEHILPCPECFDASIGRQCLTISVSFALNNVLRHGRWFCFTTFASPFRLSFYVFTRVTYYWRWALLSHQASWGCCLRDPRLCWHSV